MIRKCKECNREFEGGKLFRICSDNCRRIREVRGNRERYLKNPEVYKERTYACRKDPEFRRRQYLCAQKWQAKNRTRVRESKNKSALKRLSILRKIGIVTPEIRLFIYLRDLQKCLCCGLVDKLTVDHIVPISHGGRTEMGNLQTLCASCNSKKHKKIIDYRK